MTDTLRYRVWDIGTKEMVTPSAFYGGLTRVDFYSFNFQKEIGRQLEDVVLMEYIGLRDVNKKEIFVGDIVEWDDGSNGKWRRRCVVGKEKAHYTLVGYYYDINNPTKKTPIDFKFGQFIYENDGELHMIGNIYENPELIK